MNNKSLFFLEAEDYLEKKSARLDFGRAIVKPPIPYRLKQQLNNHSSNKDWSSYGSWKGLPELRKKIAEIHSSSRSEKLLVDQIIVTHGATGARQLYLKSKKPKIAIQSPYFFDYSNIPNLSIVTNDLDQSLQDQDAFLISNPHNPLGVSLSQEKINYLSKITQNNSLDLLIDSAYKGFMLKRDLCNLPNDAWELISVGKSLGMTDMRIGALILPRNALRNETLMNALHQQQNNQIIAISQHEQRRALDKLQYLSEFQEHSREYLERISNYFKNLVKDMASIESVSGGDAGIHFIKYKGSKSSREIAWNLLKKERIYVMPGDDFGAPFHLRICLGKSNKNAVTLLASLLPKYLN